MFAWNHQEAFDAVGNRFIAATPRSRVAHSSWVRSFALFRIPEIGCAKQASPEPRVAPPAATARKALRVQLNPLSTTRHPLASWPSFPESPAVGASKSEKHNLRSRPEFG